jgi:hypothetical protein
MGLLIFFAKSRFINEVIVDVKFYMISTNV